MKNQLTAMVSTLSDWIPIVNKILSENGNNNEGTKKDVTINPLQEKVANNIQGLTEVMCNKSNACVFLSHDGNSTLDACAQAGLLASLVTQVLMTFPLQTPSYVGLTLAIEEHAPEDEEGKYDGFAGRCVRLVLQRLVADLDGLSGAHGENKIEVEKEEAPLD